MDQLQCSLPLINYLLSQMLLRAAFFIAAFVLAWWLGSNHRIPSHNKSENAMMQVRSNLHLLSAKIDSLVESEILHGIIPGAVVLVSQEGQTILHQSYGHAQIYNYGRQSLPRPKPMTIHHRFDLASLTKVCATTYGIMLLIDREKLQLDVPVHQYLTEFRGPSRDSITIRHLLMHTSGLPEWKPIYYHANTAVKARQFISQLPLRYPVGKSRHYSDLGFMVLGYIIEEVSGVQLNEFLHDNFYKILDLKYTAFKPSADGTAFAATSHGNPFERKMVADDTFGFSCDEDPSAFQDWRKYTLIGEVNDGNAYHTHQGIAGHAGLFSTAADLKILVEVMLHNGMHQGKQIISKKIIDEFLTKDIFGHGLGWAMSDPALPVDHLPEYSFGHTGFTGTFILALPKYKSCLIVLTNRQNLGVNPDGRYPSVNNLRRSISNVALRYLQN